MGKILTQFVGKFHVVVTNVRNAFSSFLKPLRRIADSKAYGHSEKAYKTVHHHVAARPHTHLMGRSRYYAAWHTWQYKKIDHSHVHRAVLAVYSVVVILVVLSRFGFVFAADLSDNWNFSNSNNFTFDGGLETNGTSTRLAAQNYTTDANTSALYHLDEVSGSTAADSSANANNATVSGGPTFGAGNLNNGITLNGTTQSLSAPDSASLSVTGQQTIEGWIKPNSTFNNNSTQSQSIVDKGSYRLNMDRTSGKIAYEIENSGGDQWTKRVSDDTNNGGWTFNHTSVESMINYGSDIIAGTGQSRGDGEVWKWNGSTWTKIGGDGISNSWADQTYEQVTALASNGTALYAGLGNTAGDAEVWTCDLATNCTSWTKIAGDGLGGITTAYSTISSFATHSGVLYAGTGLTGAGNGDVFKYNGGTSWTQVGGDGLNSSWAASMIEKVATMYSDGTYLYAGLGTSTNDADIWRYNGTSWTQVGGDGITGSYGAGLETVHSLTGFGGNLYAAFGDGGQEASVYKYNGTTWTQIGGNPVGGWNSATINATLSLVNDGTNLYAGNGQGAGAGEVFKYTGSTWTKIGGASVNNSWAAAGSVSAMVFANSKLYAAPWSTATANMNSMMYEWNGTTWTNTGGNFLNNSWGGNGIARIDSTTTMNGKMYIGLGNVTNAAQVYEYDGTTARRIGGAGLDGSWAANTYEDVSSMTSYKGELYVGLGSGAGDAEVWKWNGSTWTKIGGDGINSAWGTSSENNVPSMTVWNGNLYVGLGTQAYQADIWKWDGSTWTLVAGTLGNTIAATGVNGSWYISPRSVESMTVWNDQLCAGLGGSGAYSELWCWTGTGNWTKIGGGSGAGVNSSWASAAAVTSLAAYKGELYAGIQGNSHQVSVWKWNGTTWTQVAGQDVNSTWSDGAYTYARALTVYNGNLYFGVGYSGSSNPTGDVWRWNGSAWSQVGGDGINGGWTTSDNREEVATLTTYKGKLYAGLGFSGNNDAILYSFGNNGYAETTTSSFDTSWKHIAATYDGINMKLYINGVLDSTTAVSTTGVDNSMPLSIGGSWGSPINGDGQGRFNGSLDEIRISNTARSSFNSKPYVNTEQAVSLASAVRKSGVATWAGFSSSETTNGGAVNYRLSDDEGVTWKYWNGSTWTVSSGLTQANNTATINSHIGTFPVGFSGIKWQGVLKGDGSQRVTLNSVTLTANSDSSAPSANAHNIAAFTSNGGISISSNAWTNGTTPYFTWDAATDNGSGVLGYCVYLGQTSGADPVSTKGLLGTSPANSANHCQFMVASTSLNLATAGLLGTGLSTSTTPYYLNIKAIDKAGNIYGSSEQFQFRFDNSPPSNPAFITAPSEFVSNKEVTFTWPTVGGDAASDPDSGVAGLQYRIGSGGQWHGDGTGGAGLLNNDGSYTTRNDPDFPDINDGNNVFYFRTQDQAGNVSAGFTSATLRLNTGSPSGPQSLQATPTTNTTNSFAFSWSAPSSFAGSANTLTYCYTVNTLPTANTCTYTAAGATSVPAGAYATQPGENTFYVVAKDNNINYATATSTTFTANTSAPGMPLDLEIADVSTKATSSWKLALSWNVPTSVGAGVSSYRVFRSTDNNTFTQVASTGGSSYVDTGLSQSQYYYKIKACDSANNCGAYSEGSSKTPTGRFTSPANMVSDPQVSGVSTKKATVRWTTDRKSDSKISIGTTSGNYEPYQIASDEQVTSHTVDLANLTPGTTYFAKATWTDEDGNIGSSSEFSFKTEPAPSTQEVITQRVSLSSAQIRFTSISAAKVVIQFGKTDSFGGVKEISTSLSKSTYDVELPGLDDGTKYLYRLNTFDAEGNEYTGSTVLSFTTPARPHIDNLRFQPVEGEPTSTQKVTWTTNVPTSSLIRFTAEGAPAKEVSTSTLVTDHEMVIKDLLDDTSYSLVAESRDAGGNLAVSDTQVLRTALDTRPPKISDVTVEAAIRGTGAEARGQIVVSWKTDEPATSQVAYAEGSQTTVFNNKTAEDGSLALEHIVIVSDLPTSKVYSVQPISQDNGKNSGVGEIKSAIIGRASDSVVTIVLNTLKKVFGF